MVDCYWHADSNLVSLRTLNPSKDKLQTQHFMHVQMKTMANMVITDGCSIYFDGGIFDRSGKE